MLEWLAIWGVGQATWFVFPPILEDLAKAVAKDSAKSYVGSCFKKVFSPIHRKPLAAATGRALKELLELIQNELLDADLEREQIEEWIDKVRRFTEHDEVREAIGSLYLEPDYKLDPATFARAWQSIPVCADLPDEFSWPRVSKRFARKVAEIRQASGELKETFDSLAAARMSDDMRELVGLPPAFDLETYRDALSERFGNLNFEMLDTTGAYYSAVRLWSVFVPQSVRECHEYYPQLLEIPKEHLERLLKKGELDAEELAEAEKHHDVRRRKYISQPLRPVLDVVVDPTIQRTVILGDPGSGKSSLLRFLALRWARIEDANLRYTQPLPLLIELRDYNLWDCPNGKSFPKYLHEASTWHRLNQQTLDHLLKEPDRVVLLLDGLDEVFDPAQRERVVNDITRFSHDYPNTRVVVTSRVVGYQPQRLRDAEFRHFMLQDLSVGTQEEPGQIDAFLDKWHDVTFASKEEADVKRERLRQAIRDSKPIAMLAGNPLLLTMMAILNRHQELPRDRAELYSQAARVLLHQWDTERALEDYPELRGEVDLRAKTAILRSVAYTMQNGPHGLAGNIIDGETLTSLIEDYLHTELHFQQARKAAAAVVRQLRERNFILCFLGADSYAFVHRTFLEYFCAADFVHRFHVEKTLDIDGLIKLFDKHCREDDWLEVLRLICGQIDEQFVGRIVEHLATRMDVELGGPPEMALAIYCLSEIRNLLKFEEVGEVLLQKTIRAARSACGGNTVADFFLNVVIPACNVLGSRWPRRSTMPPRDDEVEMSWNLRNPYVELLTAIEPNRIAVELIATGKGDDILKPPALLALSEKWPDETTRKLLEERAVQDEDGYSRLAALQALAEKWPDEVTRELLAERARVDWFAASLFGKMHSKFGRIVFTKDLDGISPFRDPTKPLSREHIEKAAKKADVPSDKIDETVRSLSAYLGWDITKGSASAG